MEMCLICGARTVTRSDMCWAHGGRPDDWDKMCEFREIHIDGVPCRWCDPVEGEW